MNLDDVRARIDEIDREIVAKLNERLTLAGDVAAAKAAEGKPIFMPEREEQIFRKLAASNEGPLDEATLRSIYREIISLTRARQRQLRIAYLGPEATYTEQAALKTFGQQIDAQALVTIPDVFAAVTKDEADYGVIPIENSTGGAVMHSLDMLAETDLKIVSQVYLPIEHCLIARSPLDAITEVHSKDQALIQCRDWLGRNLPKARQIECDSTAQAVRRAGESEGVAAIASLLAAEKYGVPVQAQGIQDRSDNITRFLVIGREPCGRTGDGADKTSIVFSIRDEVGALERALQAFSKRELNLTKIESRPSRKKAWDYLFFADILGHWDDASVQEAVTELQLACPLVKWLGSYPNVK
ncbi:MAG: prephenate dehydratase [Verrucomicrobiota bacterium]